MQSAAKTAALSRQDARSNDALGRPSTSGLIGGSLQRTVQR